MWINSVGKIYNAILPRIFQKFDKIKYKIYIIESKGDQLAENLDTKYKELVFQKMTEVASDKGFIKKFSQYDFQLVPQSETRSAIRKLFA